MAKIKTKKKDVKEVNQEFDENEVENSIEEGVSFANGFQGNESYVLLRKSQSSVEITQDAKGQTKTTVKVYDDDPHKAAQIAIEIHRKAIKDLGIG